MMKRILLSAVLMSFAAAASAQNYYVDAQNPDILRFGDYRDPVRKELVMPVKVGGYNVYKSDLHTHTVYSDGSVTPQFRIKEAWLEGLDVVAVTEHIEYRPFEKEFGEYVNADLSKDRDLNAAVRLAQKEGAYWGIFIIPGTEITRDGTSVGHFNALFTQDNNTIYDEDPVQAIRNAKAQGALVMHNHPGWWRTSIDYTETERTAYSEGLIDGVEVMNFNEFYPGIIDRVQERGLFIAANTDIHASSAEDFNSYSYMRPMTLIFATEKTERGLREALEAGRTLAFGFNTLCGSEDLLSDFFNASVVVRPVPGHGYMLTNMSSVPYVLQFGESNPVHLDPFTTIRIGDALQCKVLNMFCGKDEHPLVDLYF